MAITSQVTAGATPVQLIVGTGRDVVVRNHDTGGTNHVVIGGPGLTTANGFRVDSSTTTNVVRVPAGPGEIILVLAVAGTPTVSAYTSS